MPVQPTTWLEEFTANSDTAGSQYATRVVQLADGSFWIVWTDDNDTAGPGSILDIVGQRYDALGNAIGGPVQLNTSWVVDNERSASLASLVGSNGFAMAFVDDFVDDQAIRMNIKDATGTTTFALTIANDPDGSGAITLDHPSVAIASATHGLVAYERTNNAGDTDILGQFFNPSTGTLIGAAFVIWDEADDSTRPQVVALSNGNYAVAFVDEFSGSATDVDVRVRIYDQTGAFVAAANPGFSGGLDIEGSITALTGGGFVVSSTQANDIIAKIYNNAGVQVGSQIFVATGTNSQNESNVVSTNDGGFVVMWEDDTASQTLAQAYDSAGVAVGTAYVIADHVQDGGADEHSAIMLGDGRIVYAGTAFGDAIAEIIDPRAVPNDPAVYSPVSMSIGTIGNDSFTAAGGADETHGWDGNDTITDGGGTNANIFGDDGEDTIIMLGISATENAHGGNGSDTLMFSHSGVLTGTVTIDLGLGTATDSGATMAATGFENVDVSTWSNPFAIIGNAAINVLRGGTGNDTITGTGGGDSVYGGGGDDILRANSINNLLDGGAGNDTADFFPLLSGAGTNYFWNLADGFHGNASMADPVTLSFASIENFRGLNGGNNFVLGSIDANHIETFGGNDSLNGQAGNDTLIGGAGNDTLIGSIGIDSMVGGLGDDTYNVENTSDVVDETGGDGVDLIFSTATFTLGAGLENLTLTGAGAINGWGNGEHNLISGNTGTNILSGYDGNDTLLGGGGHDTLNGGNDADSIEGGSGNDQLNGGTGADTMLGGVGNDTYIVDQVGDVVDETGGGGTDEVRAGITYTLAATLENLVLTGAASINGTGNAGNNVLTGNTGNNSLVGGGGNDQLNGGDGNDTLSGGTGNDTMLGGAGSDVYFVDSLTDVADETGGSGAADEVRATLNWTLAAGIERLLLQGTALNGTGNAGNNVLIGNVQNNVLTGGAGSDRLEGDDGNDFLSGGTGVDTMLGGAGNDIYLVDALGDVTDETGGGGTADEVRATVSGYTLAGGIERLRLQGVAVAGNGNIDANSLIGNGSNNDLRGFGGDDGLFGYGGADTLQGGSGADSLFGGGGADVLQGGTERDILRGDLGNDRFVWNDGEFAGLSVATADRIIDFTQGSDKIDLSLVDAVNGGADNAFTFIGGAGFGSVAGQLRFQYFAVPNVTMVEGDTNGDGNADIAIALVGNIVLNAGDFVL